MSASVHRLFDDPAPTKVDDSAAVAAFEALWKVWPRRDGKAIARTKYLGIVAGEFKSKTLDKSSQTFFELNLTAKPEDIQLGAKRYLESQKAKGSGAFGYVDGGKWIPHLATWLGRAGWEDWL